MDRNHPLEIVQDIETFAKKLKREDRDEEAFYNLLKDIKLTFQKISDEGLNSFRGHIFMLNENIPS